MSAGADRVRSLPCATTPRVGRHRFGVADRLEELRTAELAGLVGEDAAEQFEAADDE